MYLCFSDAKESCMIELKRFVFNAFQVNTYVLSDETGECVIVDAACSVTEEQETLERYIRTHSLRPVRLLSTHAHVDHILGNPYIVDHYGLKLEGHFDSKIYLDHASQFAFSYDLPLTRVEPVSRQLNDGELVRFGNSTLKVLYTPGHALGSLCFYAEKEAFVITGDVLFRDSIGRTDLPGGDYEVLRQSIWEKLFVLPENTIVYPGHGPETSIGREKTGNPFVAIG